jgi:hypothetical protein
MINELSAAAITLAVLGYLLLKHMIADFVLQTQFQYANKGRYGHPGGLLHAGIHVALTLPLLFALLGSYVAVIAALAVAEFVIHYHIDFTKEQITRRFGLTTTTHAYWILFGLDQLAHNATYLAGAGYLLL